MPVYSLQFVTRRKMNTEKKINVVTLAAIFIPQTRKNVLKNLQLSQWMLKLQRLVFLRGLWRG